jgi:hypothetical protein
LVGQLAALHDRWRTAAEMASQERARLLLHWVNSLPLVSCLLVDELADLRFGDVLDDIARWVQVPSCSRAVLCLPSDGHD